MTKSELMETYTAEQLAEMVVKLQNGKEKPNMNISEIQKCQEEYEKLLKESPLEGVMNKITKDILKQKNNAMAMEFTKVICDLLKRYGVYVRCTETKLSENITDDSIEEKYGIVFDSMDFSQHDKEFTDRIKELEEELAKSEEKRKNADKVCVIVNGFAKEYPIKEVREIVRTYEDIKYCKEHSGEHLHSEEYLKILNLNRTISDLQSEVEKYRKAFEVEKKERDCQVTEYRKKIDYLEHDLKTAGEKIQDLAGENMKLQCERNDYKSKSEFLEVEIMRVKKNEFSDFLQTEPIKVADMLINANKRDLYENSAFYSKVFNASQLRQIAEHLFVYCNHNGEEK